MRRKIEQIQRITGSEMSAQEPERGVLAGGVVSGKNTPVSEEGEEERKGEGYANAVTTVGHTLL